MAELAGEMSREQPADSTSEAQQRMITEIEERLTGVVARGKWGITTTSKRDPHVSLRCLTGEVAKMAALILQIETVVDANTATCSAWDITRALAENSLLALEGSRTELKVDLAWRRVEPAGGIVVYRRGRVMHQKRRSTKGLTLFQAVANDDGKDSVLVRSAFSSIGDCLTKVTVTAEIPKGLQGSKEEIIDLMLNVEGLRRKFDRSALVDGRNFERWLEDNAGNMKDEVDKEGVLDEEDENALKRLLLGLESISSKAAGEATECPEGTFKSDRSGSLEVKRVSRAFSAKKKEKKVIPDFFPACFLARFVCEGVSEGKKSFLFVNQLTKS